MSKASPTIGLVALALGIVLGLMAHGPNTLSIDRSVTQHVQDLNGRGWHWLADFGNLLGYSVFALTILAIGIVLLAVRRDWRLIAFLSLATVLRSVGSLGKERFDSPRPGPNVAEIMGNFDGYGYPSGHVMTATVMLGALAFVVSRYIPIQIALGLAGIGVICTAFARIWFGAHWFSDTVGGALFGIAIVAIAWMLTNELQRRSLGQNPTQ